MFHPELTLLFSRFTYLPASVRPLGYLTLTHYRLIHLDAHMEIENWVIIECGYGITGAAQILKTNCYYDDELLTDFDDELTYCFSPPFYTVRYRWHVMIPQLEHLVSLGSGMLKTMFVEYCMEFIFVPRLKCIARITNWSLLLQTNQNFIPLNQSTLTQMHFLLFHSFDCKHPVSKYAE